MTSEVAIVEEKMGGVVALLSALAKDTNVDPAKMNAIMDVMERQMNKEAEIAFNEAMARVQPRIPQIEKASKGNNNQYASLEDIDRIIKPIYCAEGFSVNFDSKTNEDKKERIYFATLSHSKGHSKTIQITLPDDALHGKNAIQAAASAFSYARRYLIKALFNVIEKGEDADGNKYGSMTLDDVQFQEVTRLLEQSNTDVEVFCRHFKVDCVKNLTSKQYPKVIMDLTAKLKKLEAKNADV